MSAIPRETRSERRCAEQVWRAAPAPPPVVEQTFEDGRLGRLLLYSMAMAGASVGLLVIILKAIGRYA